MTKMMANQNGLDKLSKMTEIEIYNTVLFDVPNSCLKHLVLKNIGDFCLTKKADRFYLSVLVGENWKNSKVVDLKINKNKSNCYFTGFLYPKAENLSEIFGLIDEKATINFSEVLNEKIEFKHFVSYPELMKSNIYSEKDVEDKILIANDYNYVTYNATIKLFDKKKSVKVNIIEPVGVRVKMDFRRKLYEEMSMIQILDGNVLPIRAPIAAILDPPGMVYEDMRGYTLDYVLDSYQHNLDLTQRIKICASCVRIMSEIHNLDYFHGGVVASNFYCHEIEEKENVKFLEILLNGFDGLTAKGSSKNVNLIDFDNCAPEISFNRIMTPESGVYNIGKLFDQVVAPDLYPSSYAKSPTTDEPKVLKMMRRLIHASTRPNPFSRPTMHGVVLEIREILRFLPASNSKLNFVHFDQFH